MTTAADKIARLAALPNIGEKSAGWMVEVGVDRAQLGELLGRVHPDLDHPPGALLADIGQRGEARDLVRGVGHDVKANSRSRPMNAINRMATA